MNKLTENLINRINIKLTEKPLVYFSREVERAIGLEDYLQNYHIFCVENHYIVNQIEKKELNIYCTDNKNIELKSKSTIDLLRNEQIQNEINIIGKSGFYAQVFQNSGPIENEIKKLNGIQFNSSYLLSKKYENKISQYEFLRKAEIPVPTGRITNLSTENYSSLKNDYDKFVIQLEKSHTGGGTFIIDSQETFDYIKSKFNGNIVKITKFVKGDVYTINGCVTDNGTFVSAPQYQITGVAQLAASLGTTVGNDWSHAKILPKKTQKEILKTMQKLGAAIQFEGYKGIFGIDFIVSDEKIYVLEINARQTANVPLQTQLELKHDIVPQALINLANWLDITLDIKPEGELKFMDGAQVFLRAKLDNVKISTNAQSGIYRLQGDNSAKDFETQRREDALDGVIYLDEEKDKPFIKQKDGYLLNDITDAGVVLLVQANGTIKNLHEELARIQSPFGLVDNGNVKPWALEALKAVENMIR